MSLFYHRTLRLADTDAAGVIYFAQALAICHEAYEATLEAMGINFNDFIQDPLTALPITHAEVEFRHPLVCGDRCAITLTPQRLSENEFRIQYQIVTDSSPRKPAIFAQTDHVCIERQSRIRKPLPEAISSWIQRSQASQ